MASIIIVGSNRPANNTPEAVAARAEKQEVKALDLADDLAKVIAAVDKVKGTNGSDGAWNVYKADWQAAANNGAQIAALNKLVRELTPALIDVLQALRSSQKVSIWLVKKIK